jgi:hypothetical protein
MTRIEEDSLKALMDIRRARLYLPTHALGWRYTETIMHMSLCAPCKDACDYAHKAFTWNSVSHCLGVADWKWIGTQAGWYGGLQAAAAAGTGTRVQRSHVPIHARVQTCSQNYYPFMHVWMALGCWHSLCMLTESFGRGQHIRSDSGRGHGLLPADSSQGGA